MDKNKLNQFAGVVAADLIETEKSIDQSLAKAGMLLTTMVSGRDEVGMPALIGHHALAHLSEAISAGVSYRGHLVSLHKNLEATGRKIGADWSLGGPLEPKPDLDEIKTLIKMA